MVDEKHETIWRDIDRIEHRLRTVARHARSIIGWESRDREPLRLKVNYETRPYEWAWCLYAGAIEMAAPRGGHIV